MDLFTLFFISFFACAGIGIFIEYKIRTKGTKEFLEIKEGIIPKKVLNKNLIIKMNTFKREYVLICILLLILIFIILGINLDQGIKNPVLFLPYIVVIIFLPAALVSEGIKYLICKHNIKNNKHYFEEDILINKHRYSNDNGEKFYFIFQNQEKKIYTNYVDYEIATIGDKYYILNYSDYYDKKIPYNSNIYELEDESKIVKRVDEND